MTALTEPTGWSDEIHELSTEDTVQGGPDGVSNLPLKQLAGRTNHLRGRTESLENALPGLSPKRHNHAIDDTEGLRDALVARPETAQVARNIAEATAPLANANQVAQDLAAAIYCLKGDVPAEGNTLEKLYRIAAGLQAIVESSDADLDTFREIVAYIKSEKELIDSITTSKVSVSDIVDVLTSTATNKPLSAAQGKVLKALIDGLSQALAAHNHDTAYAAKGHTHPELDPASLQAQMNTLQALVYAGL